MLIRFIVAVLLVTTGVACKHNKRANTTVRNRAMFDFPCPKNELTLRVVDVEGARKMATQIAAYGCGKKAVYAYAPRANTWLINGAVSEMPADFDLDANADLGTDSRRDKKQAAKAEKKGKMGASATPPAAPPAVEPAPEPSMPDASPDAPVDAAPDPS